jgi:hypothetical protein
MLLNVVTRWIWSPLESMPSPMVEDWQAEAEARGCTPDEIAQVVDQANTLFPPFDLPVARQYCMRWDSPFHGDGFALVCCEMDITHFAAAQSDSRLTIFTALDDAIDPSVFGAYSSALAPPSQTKLSSVNAPAPTPPATLGDMLKALEALHIKFSAAQ